MSPEEWKLLECCRVTVEFDYPMEVNLGKCLGYGGSGAVFDFPAFSMPGEYDLVIKVLDPASQIMQQELKSIQKFRSHIRFAPALMKFRHWNGTLTVGGRIFPCYLMQKGKSLKEAVEASKELLNDQNESLRLMAFIINGICSLKEAGVSHGDIKEDNILLVAYQNTQFYMLADYGTVSECETAAKSNHSYQPQGEEYKTELEKRIAYDLYCLYEMFCRLYGIDDSLFPETLSKECCKLLRIMRNKGMRAFKRLQNLMNELNKMVNVPVSFFLDAVPIYKLEKEFPFETVMEWNRYLIVRDKNVPSGEAFDPLLLMKIPAGRYEKVCEILISCNSLHEFVMPIARYFDEEGNEYVLIHAPDDKQKFGQERVDRFNGCRIQDSGGKPYTLETTGTVTQKEIMDNFSAILFRKKINIEFFPKDIWHLDNRWKLNLFSVKSIGFTEKNAETCRIEWK